jgi:hypothetical protein
MTPGQSMASSIDQARFDVVLVFATDARVSGFDLPVLRDNLGFFPSCSCGPQSDFGPSSGHKGTIGETVSPTRQRYDGCSECCRRLARAEGRGGCFRVPPEPVAFKRTVMPLPRGQPGPDPPALTLPRSGPAPSNPPGSGSSPSARGPPARPIGREDRARHNLGFATEIAQQVDAERASLRSALCSKPHQHAVY